MNYGNTKLRDGSKSRAFTDAFGGFNHNMRIADNEFYDSKNMTSRHYPLLVSKGTYTHNGMQSSSLKWSGLIRNDDKTWFTYELDGNLMLDRQFNISGEPYTLGPIADENLGAERTLINFGAKIIVMPDKMYFNTADTSDYGPMEKSFNNVNETDHSSYWYRIMPCDADGNEYRADSYSATEPTGVSDGHVWYDIGNWVIKVWSASYFMWTTPTIYYKYRIKGIGIFKADDGVKIVHYDGNHRHQFTTSVLKAYKNTSGDSQRDAAGLPTDAADYIVIPSAADRISRFGNLIIDGAYTGRLYQDLRGLLSVEQTMPQMDYVCECQGRLWGCKYGDVTTSETRQHISRYGNVISGMTPPQIIDVSESLQKNESFGEFIAYWAFDNNYNRIESGVTIQIIIEQGHPCLVVTANDYSGTLNVMTNYTVHKTEKLNEIYASKQQDFKSWDYYQGTAFDSYTVSLGASGKFTGCINFNGKPLFSKEDRMYIFYGDYTPYKLQENIFEGVEDGAHKSMVVYNGVLYYKGRHGIYAYSGGLPQRISRALGDLKYETSVEFTEHSQAKQINVLCAAAFDGFYYIYLQNEDYGGIYTYDLENGIWNRADPGNNFKPVCMCASSNGLAVLLYEQKQVTYDSWIKMLESDSGNRVYTPWYAETGILGLDMADEKYCRKITVRYKGIATLYIEYDSSGTWEKVMTLEGGTKSKTFTMTSNRCDHFRLKLSGSGTFYLYSIAKTIDQGSDVNNGNV